MVPFSFRGWGWEGNVEGERPEIPTGSPASQEQVGENLQVAFFA